MVRISLPTFKADDLGGSDVAAGNARGEAEQVVIDQDIGGEQAGDEAEHQAPMDVGAGNRADHVGAPISRVDGLLRLAGRASCPRRNG